MKINLNADMGEGWGIYQVGDDAALVEVVRSANVACGFHAGDWNHMDRVCRAAKIAGCSIGAHPGFHDPMGFGRRTMRLDGGEIERLTAYQIGALQAVAALSGAAVTHVKPHGALSNMAAAEIDVAMAIGRAAKAVDPRLIFVAQAGTALERAGMALGLPVTREGYADRLYEDDLQLVSRAVTGAVIGDPDVAARQAWSIVTQEHVTTRSGKVVPIAVDTICIHGDEPTGVAVARAVRARLEGAGVEIVALPALPGRKRDRTRGHA